jgi:hypothetical protein
MYVCMYTYVCMYVCIVCIVFHSVDDVWLYRGRDMSHLVSPLDKLFPLSKDGPLDGQGESGSATESIASWRTIGIGDGGNEVNHTLTYIVSLLNVCTVDISLIFYTTTILISRCMYVCMYGVINLSGSRPIIVIPNYLP